LADKRKIMAVFGTRPEAIKMASVVRALRARSNVSTSVCATGQHREMLRQALAFFNVEADDDLDLMRPDQSLSGLSARTLEAMQQRIDRVRPDWIVVQGDTTTAMAVALAGFYNKVRIAHVEAGLRTKDRFAPYPEEINRRIVSLVADLHFAPTAIARTALLAEGHDPATIHVTGNTGIDSLLWTAEEARAGRVSAPSGIAAAIEGRTLVLVTAHRRESFDGGLQEIALALRDLAQRFDDIAIVLPVHPNPRVSGPIRELLEGVERILLTSPLDYGPFVALLDKAALILTDSGGIQEEAATLGKPMLVMRDTTERPEAITAGALLVGAQRGRIVEAASALLTERARLTQMARPSDIFGDGRAGERIAAALTEA
jgi:UDP-N-acetylglucosamine 2-epimerase (non-hydrolysing)